MALALNEEKAPEYLRERLKLIADAAINTYTKLGQALQANGFVSPEIKRMYNESVDSLNSYFMGLVNESAQYPTIFEDEDG
ncbi:MAG: hypothetical protein HUJ56_10775, partial [Erysipelotrichaceae bacterium]|nr:hypothetical protein [Erysipelotrichaceae bacterium]